MIPLSQKMLAVRLNLDPKTIRSRGKIVVGYASDGKVSWRETWRRVNWEDGKLRFYERIKVER